MPHLTFLVGAGRSGTTLTTRIFEACGARLGRATAQFAEHRQLKTWLKGELKDAGFDELGQDPLPTMALEPSAKRLPLLMQALREVDVVKDVKSVFFWPFLARQFPDARFVYVFREPDLVADSCMRARFMTRPLSLAQWEDWARVYQKHASNLMVAHADRTSLVQPSLYTRQSKTGMDQLRSAVEASGLQWREDAVRSVFRPDEWTG